MRQGLQHVPSHPTLVKNKAGSDTESGDENVLTSVTDDKVAEAHLARNNNHPSDLTDGDGGDLSSESEKIGPVFKRAVPTLTGNGSNRQAREIVPVAEHSLQPGTTSCSDASSSDASSSDASFSDASFNDSGSDIDDDSDASDCQTARPCRKRKRHAPTRSRVRERDTASEQCSTNTSRAAKRLKRSPNESWTPHITIQHSHSSSSRRRAPRHSKHPRKHKQVRDCDTEKSDGEYEVERIVDVRLVLQYRANWLGYEEDPMWHDASNFKNSPSRLRDFHDANPSRPGPPCRLGIWEKCWKRDEDAAEHDDDNKPERVRKYG